MRVLSCLAPAKSGRVLQAVIFIARGGRMVLGRYGGIHGKDMQVRSEEGRRAVVQVMRLILPIVSHEGRVSLVSPRKEALAGSFTIVAPGPTRDCGSCPTSHVFFSGMAGASLSCLREVAVHRSAAVRLIAAAKGPESLKLGTGGSVCLTRAFAVTH